MAQQHDYTDRNLNGKALLNAGVVYFGDASTDGSYRIKIVSGVLVIEQRVSGSWVNRGTFGE